MKIFGKAEEFYRVRLQRMSEASEMEMDWDESILYRDPPPFESKSTTYFLVQAVDIDNNQTFDIKRFSLREEAANFQNQADNELTTLTKAEFEKKFIKQFD